MIYEKKNSGIHVYIIDYGFIIIFIHTQGIGDMNMWLTVIDLLIRHR